MLLLIDNYDSFVYILKQYFEQAGETVVIRRNDEITVDEAVALKPKYLVISPGPATPTESGVSCELIRHFSGRIPVLGVCLGHQCIGEVFGGKVIRNYRVVHGKRSLIFHQNKGVFQGMPLPFQATRYHSLVIDPDTFPDKELEITAQTKEGEIMGVRHRRYAVEGVQFHPESFQTEQGMVMIRNFLQGGQETMTDTIEFKQLITKVSRGEHLTQEESTAAANMIMEGTVQPVEVATLLSCLASKGETVDEISGFARVMRDKALRVKLPKGRKAIDIVGTGGDGHGTINVSTISAVVVASSGVCVAKHGNRAVSSKAGSADVLEAAGINIGLSVEGMEQCLQEAGISFLFAQKLHVAMKNVAPIRKQMGIRTLFNILGPLTNPAFVDYLLLGVFHKDYVEPLINVLKSLGIKRAMVVHSRDGFDEISVSDITDYMLLDNGKITCGQIDPADIIGTTYNPKDVGGGDATENAKIMKDILSNQRQGAMRDCICLNAGAALWVIGDASDIREGYRMASMLIDNGSAKSTLDKWIESSQKASV